MAKIACKHCGCPAKELPLFYSIIQHCDCCEEGNINCKPKGIDFSTFYGIDDPYSLIPNLGKDNPDD